MAKIRKRRRMSLKVAAAKVMSTITTQAWSMMLWAAPLLVTTTMETTVMSRDSVERARPTTTSCEFSRKMHSILQLGS